MSRKPRARSESGYYHIVSRGIGKQILFEETEDYQRYLSFLRRYTQEGNLTVIAYCLMENHVHLLVRAEKELERTMKQISVSYAYYFNTKYERTGPVFPDRFMSEPVEDERYLLAAVRYIHNNPLKAGICRRERYPWSSWHEYVDKSDLVSTDPVLGLAGGKEPFIEFSVSDTPDELLDISVRKRMSDEQAIVWIRDVLQLRSGTQVQTMNRRDRDKALRRMKEKGLSVRQIERLTGINRGVVLRVQKA